MCREWLLNDIPLKLIGKGFVEDLVSLVGGKRKNGGRVSPEKVNDPKVITGNTLLSPRTEAPTFSKAEELMPKQVIPLDEDDFKDF